MTAILPPGLSQRTAAVSYTHLGGENTKVERDNKGYLHGWRHPEQIDCHQDERRRDGELPNELHFGRKAQRTLFDHLRRIIYDCLLYTSRCV